MKTRECLFFAGLILACSDLSQATDSREEKVEILKIVTEGKLFFIADPDDPKSILLLDLDVTTTGKVLRKIVHPIDIFEARNWNGAEIGGFYDDKTFHYYSVHANTVSGKPMLLDHGDTKHERPPLKNK